MKESERQRIVEIIVDPIYEGFGPTLIMEKLEEFKGIVISKETVRQIMIDVGSSNLTLAGLDRQGERNIDVVDQAAVKKPKCSISKNITRALC